MAVDNVARALAAKAIAGGGSGSSSSGSGAQVQADWNVNDETNPAFIKNKPWEMGYQTVFTQDALDNYVQVLPDSTGKFVPGITAQIQIDSVPIVKDKTYYVKCSSDQGIVEYTGKAIDLQDGNIALGNADFSSNNLITETTSIAIVMNAEFNDAIIVILFSNLASANEGDVPTLTNILLTIQEVVVTKKISSDYIDLPENNQVQADWSTTVETDPSFIKNKPNIAQSDWNTSVETDPSFIKNKPDIAQSDWNTTDSTLPSFIKNKPTIPPVYMIYKSKYENGDYSQDFKKELYDAIPKGITMYYIDDSRSSYETDSGGTIYYPITAIHTYINCGEEVNIKCTYTSWSWDNNNSKYVSTVKFISFVFHKSPSL